MDLPTYELRSELHGHSKDVRCVTACGNALLSGSRDNSARLWSDESAGELKCTYTFSDQRQFVTSLAFLESTPEFPAGIIFIGCQDSAIRSYGGLPLMCLYELQGHNQTVSALAVDARRKHLVSGSWDHQAIIWSGKEALCMLEGHSAAVWSVAVLPDENDETQSKLPKVLTASADKTIKLFSEGACVRTFSGHTDAVRGLAVLSSREFLSCSNDSTVKRWCVTNTESYETYYGHENFIYSIATCTDGSFVTGGEDRTVRVWEKGGNCKQTIYVPAQSVWAVAVLANGDIACGSSDGILRVFTKCGSRVAQPNIVSTFLEEVEAFNKTLQAQDEIGGVKVSDLPGIEALQQPGKEKGQTLMVRRGLTVEVHEWTGDQWSKIGDVLSAKGPSEGKQMYKGKEYDYVFSIDVSEGQPPVKLPYNKSDDPWHVAQKFLHEHDLPQVYLDEVANFIIKNAPDAGQAPPPAYSFEDPFTGGGRYVPGSSTTVPSNAASASSSFCDPFTGAGRYVPGGTSLSNGTSSNGGADPFTGQGRYVPISNAATSAGQRADPKRPTNEKIPLRNYETFTSVVRDKLCSKLKENNALVSEDLRLTDSSLSVLESIVQSSSPKLDADHFVASEMALGWPPEFLVPVLDILRLAVLREEANKHFFDAGRDFELLKFLTSFLLTPATSAPLIILVCRIFANAFAGGEVGRLFLSNHMQRIVPLLVQTMNPVRSASTHAAASAALTNYAFMLHSSVSDEVPLLKKACLEMVIVEFKSLENSVSGLYGCFQTETLTKIIQFFATMLWGDEKVIAKAKALGLAQLLCHMKDAVSDENVKNLVRVVERQIDVL